MADGLALRGLVCAGVFVCKFESVARAERGEERKTQLYETRAGMAGGPPPVSAWVGDTDAKVEVGCFGHRPGAENRQIKSATNGTGLVCAGGAWGACLKKRRLESAIKREQGQSEDERGQSELVVNLEFEKGAEARGLLESRNR